MFKKIQYGIALVGLPLSLIAMTAHANYANCRTTGNMLKGELSAPLCDISFSTIPTFSCTATFPQTGVYTLTNNTPVTIQIGTATLTTLDGSSPTGDVDITGNTCGSSLASGASCNITVSLSSGPYNQVLQISVNSRQVVLNSPIIGCVVAASPVSANFPCALGTTSTFGVLAGSGITNTGPTVINGDLGLYPGTSVTGFPPGIVNGQQYIANSTALTAQNDLTTLYTCLAAQPCGTTIGTTDQAGNTLNSSGTGAVNVICSGSTINVTTGTLTLSGDATSVFILQAGSALNLTDGSITLAGGLTAANVFWQVTSSAALTGTSSLEGTIAALTSITLTNGDTINGRALARNGAVTFDTNTVTVP